MSTLLNVDLAITTQTDQSLLTQAILSQVADSGEIDAAVLFVPNNPPAGRSRSTGPLGQLRLAGMAGISESILDSSVLGWQMVMANYAYQTNQSYFIENLREDSHPGAQALHRVGGFLTSAILPLMDHGDVKGVLQFFNRKQFSPDSDWKTFFQSLALQTAIGLDRVEMLENLKRSNRELAMAYEETVKGWGQALELRDQETRGHTERVTRLTQRLAESMGIREPDLTNIRLGALLHDVGKMAIPDSILRNTGPLNQDQWVTMRQHTTIAYNMLYNIEYLRPALEVVYSHHEKWDGSGYPRGLKEEEIPLSARIFAVVDVWDALTTDRPYRLAWPLQEAREYIRQQSGKHFDPRVVEYFLKLV
jgi:putative nucleotidyltransferase with HDIG domain